MTGYLTQKGIPDGNRYNLAIPNREIRNIITEHILSMFKDKVKNDGEMANAFCNALIEGNKEIAEKIFSEFMKKTISVRDTFVTKPTKENFYHGILLGILSYKAGWSVKSNKESGDGYSDILVQIDDSDTGIVIEVKYALDGQERDICKKAIDQINEKQYAIELKEEGIHKILKYGIACNRKSCCIELEKENSKI